MDKRLNRISLAWGVPGLLVQVVGVILRNTSGTESLPILGELVLLLGAVMLIVGLAYYAKGKGYHPAWGLLGLLSLIGFIVLGVMPDRQRRSSVRSADL